MEKIYILKKNKLFIGPYSLERLKERPPRRTDMIWYEGLPDWTPADEVELLKDIAFVEGDTEKPRSTIKSFLLNLFTNKHEA